MSASRTTPLRSDVEAHTAAERRVAFIDPGDTFTLPALTADGEHDITYFAVDAWQHGGAADAPGETQLRR